MELEGDVFSSYIDVGRKSAERRLVDVGAQPSDEQAFKDDEIPDLLYTVYYVNNSGKVIDSKCYLPGVAVDCCLY